ncbi:MAG: lysine--tRNA ligase [Candidatus Methylarchaceae archaeon HK01M]|nr:lysine--tRNA ligase [Candidatus Methylarchaceae archaeon HK01M]
MVKGSAEIIGRGTWIDKVAKKIIEREDRLRRSKDLLHVESGIGASGIPHIGSLSDGIRAYGVKLALEDMGYRSELVAFSDDMDGLRKIPVGLPEDLSKFIGTPVSMVPDPFSCHDSYGDHMSSLLIDALDRCNMKYKFQSGTEAYKSGLMNKEITLLLEKADTIGRKIAEISGQKKFERALPYFPLCDKCNRMYVAEAYEYLPDEKSVLYKCVGSKIGTRWVEGCGYEDKASVINGQGKLSWKVEFAARWSALDIRFEAYGKDIADSVKINDWVSDHILDFPHPYHVKYEMFLDKSGKKISKSLGNVFTPQTWLRYGSPQSLILLMFKRVAGSRNLSMDDIPSYMEEYDLLEDIYFGKIKIKNPSKLMKLRGLYEYVNLLDPPEKPSIHLPYKMLVQLASIAPRKNILDYVINKLMDYRVLKEVTEDIVQKIRLASNWAYDFKSVEKKRIVLKDNEKWALKQLAEYIKEVDDAERIQTEIFEIARRNKVDPPVLFKIVYKIVMGSDKGPRLGRYIIDIGREDVTRLLLDQIA